MSNYSKIKKKVRLGLTEIQTPKTKKQ